MTVKYNSILFLFLPCLQKWGSALEIGYFAIVGVESIWIQLHYCIKVYFNVYNAVMEFIAAHNKLDY